MILLKRSVRQNQPIYPTWTFRSFKLPPPLQMIRPWIHIQVDSHASSNHIITDHADVTQGKHHFTRRILCMIIDFHDIDDLTCIS